MEQAHEEKPEQASPMERIAPVFEPTHAGHSAYEIGEGAVGALGAESRLGGALEAAAPVVSTVAAPLAILGGIKGGQELHQAYKEGNMTGSTGSQGALDVGAAGLGGASAALGMAGVACPPLAIAAGAAGLGAYGNEFAENHGWYGQHTDAATGQQQNATFLNSIGDAGQQGWNIGHQALGNNIAGDVMGGIGAGVVGGVQTVANTGAAIGGGVARIGSNAWGAMKAGAQTMGEHPEMMAGMM